MILSDGSILLMGGVGGGIYRNDVWRSGDGGKTWLTVTSNAAWSGERTLLSCHLLIVLILIPTSIFII